MKYIFIFAIGFYQLLFSPFIKQVLGVNRMCRFSPSCSEYAKQIIMKYGIIKGGYISLLRFLSCQPWFGIMNNELRIMGK